MRFKSPIMSWGLLTITLAHVPLFRCLPHDTGIINGAEEAKEALEGVSQAGVIGHHSRDSEELLEVSSEKKIPEVGAEKVNPKEILTGKSPEPEKGGIEEKHAGIGKHQPEPAEGETELAPLLDNPKVVARPKKALWIRFFGGLGKGLAGLFKWFTKDHVDPVFRRINIFKKEEAPLLEEQEEVQTVAVLGERLLEDEAKAKEEWIQLLRDDGARELRQKVLSTPLFLGLAKIYSADRKLGYEYQAEIEKMAKRLTTTFGNERKLRKVFVEIVEEFKKERNGLIALRYDPYFYRLPLSPLLLVAEHGDEFLFKAMAKGGSLHGFTEEKEGKGTILLECAKLYHSYTQHFRKIREVEAAIQKYLSEQERILKIQGMTDDDVILKHFENLDTKTADNPIPLFKFDDDEGPDLEQLEKNLMRASPPPSPKGREGTPPQSIEKSVSEDALDSNKDEEASRTHSKSIPRSQSIHLGANSQNQQSPPP